MQVMENYMAEVTPKGWHESEAEDVSYPQGQERSVLKGTYRSISSACL